MTITQSDILYEDNHLLAVNKIPGVLVQGDITGDESMVDMVKDFLKVKYQKPGNVFAGLVHRLDRPVSGVVLFAKTSKALERMSKIFHDRDVQKTYLAIVTEKIDPEGVLDHWISKDENINRATVYQKKQPNSKEAKLSFKLLAKNEKESLIEIKPYTGRAHQIRAQMAFINAPIKGDVKYGYDTPNNDKSICLHAFSLSFEHPVQKIPIKIVAPLPNALEWKNFSSLINI